MAETGAGKADGQANGKRIKRGVMPRVKRPPPAAQFTPATLLAVGGAVLLVALVIVGAVALHGPAPQPGAKKPAAEAKESVAPAPVPAPAPAPPPTAAEKQ